MLIVLGSSSPRRKALLSSLFNTFAVIHPNIEENPGQNEPPLEFVRRAALEKCDEVSQKTDQSHALIIASDTIVTIDNTILGKPNDFGHACSMLSHLSGKTHQVISAISMIYYNITTVTRHNDFEITNVTFRTLTQSEIAHYLSSIDYTDKAGSYAVQEQGARIIQNIDGSLTNVVGFPLRCFFRMLYTMDIIQNLFCVSNFTIDIAD